MNEQMIRDIAVTLHTALCPKHHDDEILSTLNDKNLMCRWYIENQCEDPWERQDHLEWMLRAKILVKKLEEADDAIDFITHTLKVCRNLIMMRTLSEDGETFVMEMLSDFYSRE